MEEEKTMLIQMSVLVFRMERWRERTKKEQGYNYLAGTGVEDGLNLPWIFLLNTISLSRISRSP